MITFTIPGKPFGKQRPRFGNGRTYTPKETVSFESTVRGYAMKAFDKPIEGPVRLTVLATFETPKSWSKKKTADMIHRHHTQKPDFDNIIKAIEDGMNRIAYIDDSQVAEYGPSRKMWGNVSQTVVIVEEI